MPAAVPAAIFVLFLFSAFRTTAQIPGTHQSAPVSQPAVFDLDKDRQLFVSLDGPWRRQVGDDPAWANPDFDDSNWPIVRPGQPWSEQKFSGTAWYRAKIRVPANAGPLALYLNYIDDSHQIFANGKILRSAGGLPPNPKAYGVPPSTLALPSHLPANQPYTITLAIRVWLWPGYADVHRGGIRPGLLIGSPELVQNALEVQITRWSWDAVSHILLAILEALAANAALALFAFRRKEREYLWFSLFLFASAGALCFFTYYQFHTLSGEVFGAVYGFLAAVGGFAEILFYFRLLGSRRNWSFWITLSFAFALLCLTPLDYFGFVSNETVYVLVLALEVPITIWILALLIRRAIQGFPDARLLITPVFCAKMFDLLSTFYWVVSSLNLFHGSSAWVDHTFAWPFDISLPDIGQFFFLIGMLSVLLHRFTRTRMHEESYEREREAARTVQQLLIPNENPHIPGFEITSIYQPASEISGDFFQIIPLASGSALIAIGDVSGKGLPAALMVSLAVGTLRTYAETINSPAEILSGLNRRLHGRTGGGFTTCIILRVDPDGVITIANAGHLAPYIAGHEIPVESGLPLGILSNATYQEVTLNLTARQSITLITDGVVEARNTTGELFGFERTQTISEQSAAEIARTAQAFGQDDDITVLKLTRTQSGQFGRSPVPHLS